MTTAEQVLEALGKLGISKDTLLAELTGGGDRLPARRQAKRGEQHGRHWRSTVMSSPPRAIMPSIYGKSPVVLAANNMPDAAGTHRARMAALEQAIPGINKVAYVFSVGKDANGKLCKTFTLMVNIPFTYIELPQGKYQTVGGMTPEQVRAAIKQCGYGFTKQKDSAGNACFYWGTDSRGNALRRQFGKYTKLNAAAMMVSESE